MDKVKLSRGDKILLGFFAFLLVLVCIVTLYPVYYMAIVSISEGNAVLRDEVHLYAIKPNLIAYRMLLTDKYVPIAYMNTIIYTVTGTTLSVLMTALCAYPLSRPYFYGRKTFTAIILFTMFFGVGLIPNYMLVNNLHLRNTIWALVLPGAIDSWDMIMMRTFFSGLPEELMESARLDGATEFVIFFRIVLPLSKAVIATMVLFYAVGQWNSFMSPLLYMDDINRMPMQLIIRRIVIGSESLSGSSSASGSEAANYATNVKYAAMFITILPILALYPFLQKYFVKGVMVGSLKG